jgi:hypothetical protein
VLGGGSYEEGARWLHNFVVSHAKRESPRVEGLVEAEDEREGKSYGVRLRLGDRVLPPPDQPALELTYPEVAEGKGSFAWCEALARRVRGLARELLEPQTGQSSRSA